MGTSAVVRVIEQCCFNSVPDLFNGQTVNFILKSPKVMDKKLAVFEKIQTSHSSEITLFIALLDNC